MNQTILDQKRIIPGINTKKDRNLKWNLKWNLNDTLNETRNRTLNETLNENLHETLNETLKWNPWKPKWNSKP